MTLPTGTCCLPQETIQTLRLKVGRSHPPYLLSFFPPPAPTKGKQYRQHERRRSNTRPQTQDRPRTSYHQCRQPDAASDQQRPGQLASGESNPRCAEEHELLPTDTAGSAATKDGRRHEEHVNIGKRRPSTAKRACRRTRITRYGWVRRSTRRLRQAGTRRLQPRRRTRYDAASSTVCHTSSG